MLVCKITWAELSVVRYTTSPSSLVRHSKRRSNADAHLILAGSGLPGSKFEAGSTIRGVFCIRASFMLPQTATVEQAHRASAIEARINRRLGGTFTWPV